MNNKRVSFDYEKLILVDENDRIIGYDTKANCHKGEGILHRAFSIFILNSKGELLLQKRSNKKTLWPNYWSNSCCSHPRENETMEDAIKRRLYEELGLKNELEFVYKFKYHAKYKDIGAEREICYVYIGYNNDLPTINKNEISEYKYINKNDLFKDISENPETFTPWFLMEIKNIPW